jgi:HK97 family phage major capsid protein
MTRIMAEISPVGRMARTVMLDGGTRFEEVVDKDQTEAVWATETGARGDTTTPTLRKFSVGLDELYAQPKATQTLIDVASIDVMGWLTEKVGEAFGATESAAFHTGNGIGKPRGFLDYPTAATGDATRAWGTTEHIPSGASGAFQTPTTSVNPADCLVDVTASLRAQYRNGAIWLMNRQTAGAVRKLKDADGRHVWTDSLVLGQPSTLLGYGVEISEDMPVIAANSLSIAFGNWRKFYTVIRRLGVRFLVDPYTDKPNVRLFSYSRVGGGVANFEAMKLLKFAAS